MAESNDVQTLEKISTEVDESQFKIILSSQCIKAQAYLVDKLRKQTKQQKQVCNYISNGNLKLETEIKLAEQELKSLLSAVDTIKIANVDLKKDLLIAKDRKVAINERVTNGIKKYEELWTAAKRRYESIPFIHSYLQAKNKRKLLNKNILNLKTEIHKLTNDITIRKIELINLDKIHIIEVAKYMIQERPQTLLNIREKSNEVKELLDEIRKLSKKCDATTIHTNKSIPVTDQNCEDEAMDVYIEGSWPNLTTDIDNTMMLPKLQLRNFDLDNLTIKLDQIKKGDSQNLSKRTDSEVMALEQTPTKKKRSDEIVRDVYVSSYFQSPSNLIQDKENVEFQTKNYSEKKLIYILEDIKLDSAETRNIVSNIKPGSLQDINIIKAEKENQKELFDKKEGSQKKIDETIGSEKIEKTDLKINQSPNILIPPTQFLDRSQNSQERKTTPYGDPDSVIDLEKNHEDEIGDKDGQNNQLNASTASEDSYTKIKETIYKKHKLDLSPQFTYSKNSTNSKKPETSVMTSKYFLEKNDDVDVFDNIKNIQIMEIDDTDEKITSQCSGDQEKKLSEKNIISNEHNNDKKQPDLPVSGLLFTHGIQDIPDSLDVSMSTTGYEEADGDYPLCIDSSLLLSPKADVQLPEISDNNSEILSQEVPNFLSGIRKTGFSFFGKSSSENTADSMTQNQSNKFTFTFGGDEKKNRGGFFNIFH